MSDAVNMTSSLEQQPSVHSRPFPPLLSFSSLLSLIVEVIWALLTASHVLEREIEKGA